MPLELCHVRLSDGPAVAEIYGKCFAGTPLYTVLHPGMDEAALSNDFLTRWPGMFTNPKGFYIGVKETDTDTLVAFTRYMKVNIPLSETEQEALRTWKPPVKARKNWAFERFFQSELQSVIEEDGRLQEAGGRPQLCKSESISDKATTRHLSCLELDLASASLTRVRVRSRCYIARVPAPGCGRYDVAVRDRDGRREWLVYVRGLDGDGCRYVPQAWL